MLLRLPLQEHLGALVRQRATLRQKGVVMRDRRTYIHDFRSPSPHAGLITHPATHLGGLTGRY